MIKKIISGGQTGADRAALDVAIKLGIPHGGWIPKGRKTEEGPLPDRYRLQEMATSGYPERTEQNVMDADGTVILSHGELSGGSERTRQVAIRHGRPCLHIDLTRMSRFNAAMHLGRWVRNNRVEVLNIAGPRASHDPEIYAATAGILESAVYLIQMGESTPGKNLSGQQAASPPRTVDQAVDRLVRELALKDKTLIANMSEKELPALLAVLGATIENAFGLGSENDQLLASCRFVSKQNIEDHTAAVMVIIDALWKRLRETHKIRIVK